MSDLAGRLWKATNRLAKWRTVFAGWQLGTRSKEDPEAAAVRDHREQQLLLRVEMNALVALLLKKGVFTEDEWRQALLEDIELMNKSLEERFPGYRATDEGLAVDVQKAAATMKRLNFKP